MKPTAAYWLAGSPIKPWNAEQLACLVFLSFFIYSNLIAIFQRRMTWWKWPGKISIIWITIYKLLTKHLHLLICDFDIKVCPTLGFMLHERKYYADPKGPLHFCDYSSSPFFHLCVHLYHGNSQQSRAITDISFSFCWLAKHLEPRTVLPSPSCWINTTWSQIWEMDLRIEILTAFMKISLIDEIKNDDLQKYIHHTNNSKHVEKENI